MTDEPISDEERSEEDPIEPALAAGVRIAEPDLNAVSDRLERALLGDERKYTRIQAASKAGVPQEIATNLWRALGFATVEDDAVVFTDADVEAMLLGKSLVEVGLMDWPQAISITRLMGQLMSRTAEWQVQWALEAVLANPQNLPGRDVETFVESLIPILERTQNYAWRRHVVGRLERVFAAVGDLDSQLHMVVGFVDLSGYTSFSRKAGASELSRELEEFESLAANLVADHHGRVVKYLGDEVLFTATTASDAAEIALGLVERTHDDEDRLPVHVGMASGEVIGRMGDIFGPVVNLASRLTSAARPGSVLVDRNLAAELADDPRYDLQRVRGLNIRNYSNAGATRLRRGASEVNPHRELLAADVVKRLRIWE